MSYMFDCFMNLLTHFPAVGSSVHFASREFRKWFHSFMKILLLYL
jgi:hypothetical protein